MSKQSIFALFAFQLCVTASFAKPPDLPIREKVDCKDTTSFPRIGGASEEQEAVPSVIDAMTPCLCDWFGVCFQNALERNVATADSSDLANVFRGFVDAVTEGIEFDLRFSGNLRVLCELQLGGVMYKVTLDEDGKASFAMQQLLAK